MVQRMLTRLKSFINIADKAVSVDLEECTSLTGTTIDGNEIQLGFSLLAEYIRRAAPWRATHCEPIKIIVAGGACSVLWLKNRQQTQDIDFFHPDADILREVLEAKRLATLSDRRLQSLPHDWINANMMAYVNNYDQCDQLYENSIRMGDLLLKSSVLEVYVADWRYQLVGKITRAGEDRDNNYLHGLKRDLDDAVEILPAHDAKWQSCNSSSDNKDMVCLRESHQNLRYRPRKCRVCSALWSVWHNLT